jgi:hypothetical protein
VLNIIKELKDSMKYFKNPSGNLTFEGYQSLIKDSGWKLLSRV